MIQAVVRKELVSNYEAPPGKKRESPLYAPLGDLTSKLPVYEQPRTKMKSILKNVAFMKHLEDFCAELNQKVYEIYEQDLENER